MYYEKHMKTMNFKNSGELYATIFKKSIILWIYKEFHPTRNGRDSGIYFESNTYLFLDNLLSVQIRCLYRFPPLPENEKNI